MAATGYSIPGERTRRVLLQIKHTIAQLWVCRREGEVPLGRCLATTYESPEWLGQ